MYRAVVEAATGRRELSEDELARNAERVAQAGFDPDYVIAAGSRLSGFVVNGNPLEDDDELASPDFHYLLHVIVRREWPESTTKEEYERSIRDVITDPETGVYVSRYKDQGWQLAFFRGSKGLEGHGGGEWVLVEYNLNRGYWTTAFQPRMGRDHLDQDLEREDGKWLREPK